MAINSGDSGKLYSTFTKDASLTLQSNSINTADYNQLNKALSRAASSRQSGHIYYTESGLQFMTQEQAKKVEGAVKVPLAVLKDICNSIMNKSTKFSNNPELNVQLQQRVNQEIGAHLKEIEKRQSFFKSIKGIVNRLLGSKDEIKAFDKNAKAVTEKAAIAGDSLLIKQMIGRASALRAFFNQMNAIRGQSQTETQSLKTIQLDELIKKFTKYSQDEKKLTLKERDEMRRLVVKDNGYLNSLCSSAEGLVQTTRDTKIVKRSPRGSCERKKHPRLFQRHQELLLCGREWYSKFA